MHRAVVAEIALVTAEAAPGGLSEGQIEGILARAAPGGGRMVHEILVKLAVEGLMRRHETGVWTLTSAGSAKALSSRGTWIAAKALRTAFPLWTPPPATAGGSTRYAAVPAYGGLEDVEGQVHAFLSSSAGSSDVHTVAAGMGMPKEKVVKAISGLAGDGLVSDASPGWMEREDGWRASCARVAAMMAEAGPMGQGRLIRFVRECGVRAAEAAVRSLERNGMIGFDRGEWSVSAVDVESGLAFHRGPDCAKQDGGGSVYGGLATV